MYSDIRRRRRSVWYRQRQCRHWNSCFGHDTMRDPTGNHTINRPRANVVITALDVLHDPPPTTMRRGDESSCWWLSPTHLLERRRWRNFVESSRARSSLSPPVLLGGILYSDRHATKNLRVHANPLAHVTRKEARQGHGGGTRLSVPGQISPADAATPLSPFLAVWVGGIFKSCDYLEHEKQR